MVVCVKGVVKIILIMTEARIVDIKVKMDSLLRGNDRGAWRVDESAGILGWDPKSRETECQEWRFLGSGCFGITWV